MRAGPPNPGPSRAAARAGMRAVMAEYEVFGLSFPHATSSSTNSCLCPAFHVAHFFPSLFRRLGRAIVAGAVVHYSVRGDFLIN